MNLKLLDTLKKIIASYSIPEIQKMAQGIINQFFPEVQMPEIKIINHTSPTYTGITRFKQKKGDNPEIVIELQKSILGDKRTLHRTLAHELIHVWQYSNADTREKLLKQGRYEGHGKSFKLMADKMNSFYGDKYITETSDITDVITQEKEFYILIQPHKETSKSKSTKYGVTKFSRPSKTQKSEIQRRLLEQEGHVFKTKEKLFNRSADLKPLGGYSLYKDEVQTKLAEIYNSPNLDKMFLDKAAVTSNFKTAKKKFIDSDAPVELIDEIFKRFKKLRDQHRIEKDSEKNIDYWSTKKFADLVKFVESLEKTPSKTQVKKTPWKTAIPSGAEKVAENDSWVVYKINDFEASQQLGTRNWCISRSKDHYDSETEGMVFYFLLSKTKSYGEESKDEKSGHINYKDIWHRIALQITYKGEQTFWDANDDSHINAPDEVINSLPSFNIERPKILYTLDADSLGNDIELEATNIEDAIEEAENLIKEVYSNYNSTKRTVTELYNIFVNDVVEHRGSIEIVGEWTALRKEIKGYEKLGSDDNNSAKILEFNGNYYFSIGSYEDDDYIEEISGEDAILFLLQWNELENVITWKTKKGTIYLLNDKFYFETHEKVDEYRYKAMLHFLRNETTSTPQSNVEGIDTEKALELLVIWGEVARSYYNLKLEEVLLELTKDGGYYQCEYVSEGTSQEISRILDFTKLSKSVFEETSTEEGWITKE